MTAMPQVSRVQSLLSPIDLLTHSMQVQGHVKQSKVRFDKYKLDCLQKVDLLAASRCNMFSHALILYQNALITFWEKTAKTMTHVNDSFEG